ncbi:MAG: aminomethyl-transferring glycine dehydrogenase subunit GcvPA [Clostridiales bacterium]|nr:aminomethyl-transferring glycine dehydrogenase subunit GcvPA [Clostridiales bacterium]
MSQYHPHTPEETQAMLKSLGLTSLDELFKDIPDSVKRGVPADERPGLSQMETLREMETLAARNTRYGLTLRGAGCYDHFIPPIVKQLANKKEFLSAYTPYQAELSQGVLQAIFEYQTLICELTGMDASNAGVYDFATAAAEAAVMCRERRRTVALVSEAAHPDTIAVMRTYGYGTDTEVRVVPLKDGRTDPDALKTMLADDVASLYIRQPNYFGLLEDVPTLFAAAKDAGVKCVLGVNPMTLALLPGGGELGADVVCGDVQPFGLPMAYGGPHAGFMACTKALMRRLPGRIAGQTTDAQGQRAFVLTLQAREQHIRREKAASNICTNHAHCALTASIYLTYMGLTGVAAVAQSCVSKAHYFADELCRIGGVSLRHKGEFFHEFVTDLPDPEAVEAALHGHGILSGLSVKGGMLWCVTEKASKAQLDTAVKLVREVCEGA